MLTVGDRFPRYDLLGVVSTDPEQAFERFDDRSHAGKWRVIFFYPKDFTFVCPTELTGFGDLLSEFEKRNAAVLGASTDSEYSHLAWRQHDANLKELPYPLLADIKRELSQALGILDRDEGVCLRATFIVDPDGIIRFASANDLAVGRSPEEVLRVLDALQTGELCPVSRKPGGATLGKA
jgi:peroxiredoxin (alkyl hydroperoxide reductase subunit C)